MKKLITVFALSLALFAFKPQTAAADCSQIYGGGQNCTSSNLFSIEKLVQVPGKGGGNFVDSMSINDPRYSPSQKVSFQILVKNTGSQNIPTITIVDAFPQFISFVSGPGSFDNSNKTLTFSVSNLNAGQTVKYTVVGQIADSNLMPSDQGILCLINQASGTDNNGMTNSASSQFCVQKQVLAATAPQVLPATPVKTTPATGPEMLPLFALIPGALGGFILRKKSNKTSYFQGGEK